MGKITSQTTNPVVPQPTVLMQEEIRHTEAEITETLHSIEAKLAPARLKEQVKQKVVTGAVNGVVHLGYAIQRRPLPSVALGAGLLWFLKRRRARKQLHLRQVDVSGAVVEALPKELKKNPVKTLKKYITLGRMVFAFASVASAVMMRGRSAQESLDRERYAGELGEYPLRP